MKNIAITQPDFIGKPLLKATHYLDGSRGWACGVVMGGAHCSLGFGATINKAYQGWLIEMQRRYESQGWIFPLTTS